MVDNGFRFAVDRLRDICCESRLQTIPNRAPGLQEVTIHSVYPIMFLWLTREANDAMDSLWPEMFPQSTSLL